jgi:phosphoribosylglycinamide formyltransferase 1
MSRKRVAILISGRGSNMTALVEAAKAADYPAEIALVVSNRADAAGLATAALAGVITAVLDHKPFGKDRAAFEAALQTILDQHRIELICLGGFMRLFTAPFVARWQGRMINIHPSLLPSFPGLDPHGQAIRAGVTISGATVHFVIPETDAGPIIMQAAVPVASDDTGEALAARVLQAEHRIYPQALRLLAEDRVRVVDGRCQVAGGTLPLGNLISPA